MAEIRSTLDLVLEKTRHLTLSAGEKEEMEAKETLKKVPSYLSRYRDAALSLEGLLREIDCLAPEVRQRVRQEMARQLSLALDLSPDTDPLVAALEAVAEPGWKEALVDLKRCRSEVRRALEAARRRSEERLLARLAAAGISGSAVVVKTESDQEWVTMNAELKRPCEERLDALRRAVAVLTP